MHRHQFYLLIHTVDHNSWTSLKFSLHLSAYITHLIHNALEGSYGLCHGALAIFLSILDGQIWITAVSDFLVHPYNWMVCIWSCILHILMFNVRFSPNYQLDCLLVTCSCFHFFLLYLLSIVTYNRYFTWSFRGNGLPFICTEEESHFVECKSCKDRFMFINVYKPFSKLHLERVETGLSG